MQRSFFSVTSVTLLYFLLGISWLLLGTLLIDMVNRHTPDTDLRTLYHYKNALFIVTTGVVLFFLLKQHREHLLSAEKNYHKLFEGSPGATYVMDKKSFRLLAVNDIMVKKYGYSRDQLLKMSALEIRPKQEQDRLSDYLDSEHDEGHETGIWLHQRRDGECFYVMISHHSIQFWNQDAYMVTAIDVDKNIRNEKKLKEIMWHNSHELRKPVGNIKGLIGLIKENEPVDAQIIKMLNTSVNSLEEVIKNINLTTNT